MRFKEIRSEIHELIDQLDGSFLKVVHSMLDTYVHQKEEAIIGYQADGNPLFASDAKIEYEKRLTSIEKGEFSTIEDMKKEASRW